MLRTLMKIVILAGLAALAGCDGSASQPPDLPSKVQGWLSQSEDFCKAKSDMPRAQCMELMLNGAEVAARAIRGGHEREVYLCVEKTKRENGDYLDLVSAGSCIVVATWR